MSTSKQKPSRLKALQERFPDKQINRLISFTKKCPLGRHARVVYSLLMFRCRRQGKCVPASISCLSKLSGMHRTTVAKALAELKMHYVVSDQEGLWGLRHTSTFNQMPNADWYGWRAKGGTTRELAYNWYLQPRRKAPISLVDALVYSADIQGRVSARCLSVRLNMDRKTIARSRAKLAKLEYSPRWFADIRFRKKKAKPKTAIDFLSKFQCEMQKAVAVAMLKNSPAWSQAEIDRFFTIARDHCPTDDDMWNSMLILLNPGPRSFEQLMRDHRNSSREGCGMGLVLRKMGWA